MIVSGPEPFCPATTSRPFVSIITELMIPPPPMPAVTFPLLPKPVTTAPAGDSFAIATSLPDRPAT